MEEEEIDGLQRRKKKRLVSAEEEEENGLKKKMTGNVSCGVKWNGTEFLFSNLFDL